MIEWQHVKSGLPFLADILLVGMLVWWGSSLVQRPITSTAPAVRGSQGSHLSPVNISELASMPLFGAKKTVVPEKLPVVRSTLNLKLVGTVVAGSESAAIIQAMGGRQKVYKIGDVLQPGVILEKVTSDAIVIRHQGRLERILLPKHLPNHVPTVHTKVANVDPSYAYRF